MNEKYFGIILIMILVSFVIPAHAVQLDTVIPKGSEEFLPVFTFTRIVSIQYSEDSRLAELFGDAQQKISFDMDGENAAVLIEKINTQLKERSFATVSDVTGKYSVVISPYEESVSIEYKITIKPTMKGHFISESVLDAQWRGFEILGEIPIDTEFGIYDINSPISAFVEFPEIVAYLSDSDAMKVLDMKLVDSTGLTDLPLPEWESMFDPTAKMSETVGYGFSGMIVTNYSMGICTIYRGVCQDRDVTVPFEIDGEAYTIGSIESQDDGTIIIEGYVQESSGRVESFLVTENAPGIDEKDAQVPTMYAVSGIGVIIAASFFVWSDKKSKKTSTEQTGIDPKDLCAVSTGSSVGSYQTNRGTSELR